MASTWRCIAAKAAAVSSTAKAVTHADFGFTAAEIAAADRAYIVARTGGIMVLWNGSAPTATYGRYMASNGQLPMLVEGRSSIAKLQFIREAGTDSTVTVILEALG